MQRTLLLPVHNSHANRQTTMAQEQLELSVFHPLQASSRCIGREAVVNVRLSLGCSCHFTCENGWSSLGLVS